MRPSEWTTVLIKRAHLKLSVHYKERTLREKESIDGAVFLQASEQQITSKSPEARLEA
jgi:hypothetical protein